MISASVRLTSSSPFIRCETDCQTLSNAAVITASRSAVSSYEVQHDTSPDRLSLGLVRGLRCSKRNTFADSVLLALEPGIVEQGVVDLKVAVALDEPEPARTSTKATIKFR